MNIAPAPLCSFLPQESFPVYWIIATSLLTYNHTFHLYNPLPWPNITLWIPSHFSALCQREILQHHLDLVHSLWNLFQWGFSLRCSTETAHQGLPSQASSPSSPNLAHQQYSLSYSFLETCSSPGIQVPSLFILLPHWLLLLAGASSLLSLNLALTPAQPQAHQALSHLPAVRRLLLSPLYPVVSRWVPI